MVRSAIKQCAELAAKQESISSEFANLLFSQLTKQEIRSFVFYLSEELRKQKIVVTAPDEIDEQTHNKLKELFEGKHIEFQKDTTLGGGLIIEDNDNRIDASIKGRIAQTIQTLKETL